MKPSGRDQFLGLLGEAVKGGSLVKLTLGKPAGTDPTLENLFVRPVTLKAGPRFAFVWHHATRDITKNHDATEALGLLERMIGTDFLDAHLFTTTRGAQLETGSGTPKLRVIALARVPAGNAYNDRSKRRPIPAEAPWLHALGVTDRQGRPAASMADKFRQIERFAEILGHLIGEAPFPSGRRLRVFDMGSGKGYLTFAASEFLQDRAEVIGVEARGDLVKFCSATAARCDDRSPRLRHRDGRRAFEGNRGGSGPACRFPVLPEGAPAAARGASGAFGRPEARDFRGAPG
jgi:hypothetical protein